MAYWNPCSSSAGIRTDTGREIMTKSVPRYRTIQRLRNEPKSPEFQRLYGKELLPPTSWRKVRLVSPETQRAIDAALCLQVRNGQFDEPNNTVEVGRRLQSKLNPMRILGSLGVDNRI